MSTGLLRTALFGALAAGCILPPREAHDSGAPTNDSGSPTNDTGSPADDTGAPAIMLVEQDVQINPELPDESQVSFTVGTGGGWLRVEITSDTPQAWYGSIGDEGESCWRSVPSLDGDTSSRVGFVHARDGGELQYVLRVDGDGSPTAHLTISQVDERSLSFDPSAGYHCESDAVCLDDTLSCTQSAL